MRHHNPPSAHHQNHVMGLDSVAHDVTHRRVYAAAPHPPFLDREQPCCYHNTAFGSLDCCVSPMRLAGTPAKPFKPTAPTFSGRCDLCLPHHCARRDDRICLPWHFFWRITEIFWRNKESLAIFFISSVGYRCSRHPCTLWKHLWNTKFGNKNHPTRTNYHFDWECRTPRTPNDTINSVAGWNICKKIHHFKQTC